MKEDYINVLMVKPMEHPKSVVIPNNITTFNRLVGVDTYYPCRAEVIIIDRNIGIIRNPEGALLDLKGNRKVNDEIIAGTFLIISFDEHGFIASLSEENIQKYSDRFWNIENFTDREVLMSHWNKFEDELNLMELDFLDIL